MIYSSINLNEDFIFLQYSPMLVIIIIGELLVYPPFTLSSNSTPSPLDVSVTHAQEQKGA